MGLPCHPRQQVDGPEELLNSVGDVNAGLYLEGLVLIFINKEQVVG